MNATTMAIKYNHVYVSEWCKQHSYNISAVNDILNRRGPYMNMNVPNSWTKAYAILQTLIIEGYGEQLIVDGWDISLIDTTKPIQTPSPATKIIDMEQLCWTVCELGDDYTCNIFISPTPDAGPLGILYMMEHNQKATETACIVLNNNYTNHSFYAESADVITIWTR